MLKKIMFVAGALVLVLLLAVGALRLWYEFDQPGLASFVGVNKTDALVGQPAPDFTLPVLDGDDVTLSEYRGRPVVLYFWATWCPSCKETIPTLAGAHADDVTVIAITFREKSELDDDVIDDAIRERLADTRFIAARGADGVADAYRARAIPNVIVIDSEGIIRYTGVGVHSAEAIRDAIALGS